MGRELHANASTTPTTRKYIQMSSKSTRLLSDELKVSEVTIRKWRKRDFVKDKSHTAKKLNTTLSQDEEILVCFLRAFLHLSIDRLLLVTKVFVNRQITRSALGRLIKRKNIKISKSINYINNTVSHDIFPNSCDINTTTFILLPYKYIDENIHGIFLIFNAKTKYIEIKPVQESIQQSIYKIMSRFISQHDKNLLLISEASDRLENVSSVCTQLSKNSTTSCGVYLEHHINVNTTKLVSTIFQDKISKHRNSDVCICNLLTHIQNKYNSLIDL